MSAQSTAFAVTPSTSAGELVQTGLRAVVEFAVVNSSNSDGSPAITWTDITAQVIDVRSRQGSTDGRESGAPIGQATFRCLDLSDLIGEHLDMSTAAIDRPGPGCLIRYGFRTSSTWTPIFSGIVDAIEESTPPLSAARGQTVIAYDPLYALAGFRSIGGYPVITPPITDVIPVDTALDDALDQVLTFGFFPYSLGYVASAMSSYHVVADTSYGPGGLLGTAHLIAESAGCQLYAAPSGEINVVPWSGHPYAADYGTAVSDVVRTGDGYLQAITATFRSAMADIINVAELQNTAGTYRDLLRASRTTPQFERYGLRHDSAGWPKTGLLTKELGTLATSTEAVIAPGRFAGAHPLRTITFDTMNPGEADMWLFLRSIYFAGDRYYFRRLANAIDPVDGDMFLAYVKGRELYLSRVNSMWRLQARHHVKGRTPPIP